MHRSAMEAWRCDELHLMQRAGVINELHAHPQPSWSLDVNGVHVGRYTADFDYLRPEKAVLLLVVEDVKGGPPSRDVALRLKLMKALYGIDVTIVRKVRR